MASAPNDDAAAAVAAAARNTIASSTTNEATEAATATTTAKIRNRPTIEWKKKVLAYRKEHPELTVEQICKFGHCHPTMLRNWPAQVERAELKSGAMKSKKSAGAVVMAQSQQAATGEDMEMESTAATTAAAKPMTTTTTTSKTGTATVLPLKKIRHRPTMAWKKKVLAYRKEHPELTVEQICKFGKCSPTMLYRWPAQVARAEAERKLPHGKKACDKKSNNHGRPLATDAVHFAAMKDHVRDKILKYEPIVGVEIATWLYHRCESQPQQSQATQAQAAQPQPPDKAALARYLQRVSRWFKQEGIVPQGRQQRAARQKSEAQQKKMAAANTSVWTLARRES